MADQLKFDSGTSGKKDRSLRSAPMLPNIGESSGLNRRYVDVTAMIRSLQRTEGSTDCFRRNASDCDQLECAWRQYCLGDMDDLLMDDNA